MSKITNDGLSGLAQDVLWLYTHMATVGVKGLKGKDVIDGS